MSVIRNVKIGQWFPIDKPLIAIQTDFKASHNTIIEDVTTPEDKKWSLIELLNYTTTVTEATIKANNIVITNINNYNVVTSGIVTLNENPEQAGGLIIVGTSQALKSSGLESVIRATPRCYFVEIEKKQFFTDKDERKAFTEECKALREQYKEKEDSDAPIIMSEQLYTNSLIDKYIADVCGCAYFITRSNRNLTNPKNTLVRNILINQRPSYVYNTKGAREGQLPQEIRNVINLSNIEQSVTVYKDMDVADDYCLNRFVNVLTNGNEQEVMNTIRVIPDIPTETLEQYKKDDIEIYGDWEDCSKGEIVAIYTSYLSKKDTEKNKEASSLKNLLPESYFSQISQVIANQFKFDRTVLMVADKSFGVTGLNALIDYKRDNPDVKAKAIILEGDIDTDTPEGVDMDLALDTLRAMPNVFIVSTNKKFSTTIPNTKKEKPEDKDEVKVAFGLGRVLLYVATQLCDYSIIFKAAKVGSINSTPIKIYSQEVNKDCIEYVFNKGTLSQTSQAKMKTTDRMVILKDVVDIEEYKTAIFNPPTVKEITPINGQVTPF